MDSYEVLGIEYRTSKKTGKNYKMLHLARPFTDGKYGVGLRTSVEYCNNEAFPRDLMVGDHVQLSYGRGFDGSAYVNGVHIVPSGDVPTVQVKK